MNIDSLKPKKNVQKKENRSDCTVTMHFLCFILSFYVFCILCLIFFSLFQGGTVDLIGKPGDRFFISPLCLFVCLCLMTHQP